MLEHGLIMDPRHPSAQSGFGRGTYEDPTGATQAVGEAYLRAYGELAAGIVGGPLARGVPVVAERAAIRTMMAAFDPKAGFIKGVGVGITNQMVFMGEFPLQEIPGNRRFNFGLAVGNVVGAAGDAVRDFLF